MTIMTEYEEKEVYLYLDFNGRLQPNIFNQNNLFFKAVCLDQKQPLVQIGDYVFQGNYEECVGTNLFFEEVESVQSNDVFAKDTPISLKYITHQVKTLAMQWTKFPEELVNTDTLQLHDVHFKDNYKTLLDKLDKRTLNFEDIIARDEGSVNVTDARKKPEPKNDRLLQRYLSKYDILKELMSQEQLKRRDVGFETVNVPKDLKLNYEYYNLRSKMLQRNKIFPEVILEYDKNTLEGAVDVSRCTRLGLIADFGEIPRELTEAERSHLLSFENFENLSIPMRYCVVTSKMRRKKRLIKNATIKQLKGIDEFGVTIVEAYKLLKQIKKDLFKYIQENLKKVDHLD